MRPRTERGEREVLLHVRLRGLARAQAKDVSFALVVGGGAVVGPDAEPQVHAYLVVDRHVVAVVDGRLIVDPADELLVEAEAVAHRVIFLFEFERLGVLEKACGDVRLG